MLKSFFERQVSKEGLGSEPPKREYYDGVPCANIVVSLFISFSAAPNLVIHHHLASRTQGRKEF